MIFASNQLQRKLCLKVLLLYEQMIPPSEPGEITVSSRFPEDFGYQRINCDAKVLEDNLGILMARAHRASKIADRPYASWGDFFSPTTMGFSVNFLELLILL